MAHEQLEYYIDKVYEERGQSRPEEDTEEVTDEEVDEVDEAAYLL